MITNFEMGFWGIRYQVRDVQRSIAFYTQTLGFNLDMQNLPAFGQVSIGGLKLILSGPGASGSGCEFLLVIVHRQSSSS